MHATDRVVVVAMGFGVWQGGHHVASARWADVVRVSAVRRDVVPTDGLTLALRLRDGTEILVHEALPGFEPFLAAAHARLPGIQRGATWTAVRRHGVAPNETVLFERGARDA